MAVDYDLVVVGGTELGRTVAIAAAHWKARIALVEPIPRGDRLWHSTPLYHSALLQVAHQHHHTQRNLLPNRVEDAVVAPDWSAIARTLQHSVNAFHQTRSPAVLAAQGIDVVFGQAEFVRRPRLGIVVTGGAPSGEDRVLRSRAYLIVPPETTRLPPINGLTDLQPLTPESWWDCFLGATTLATTTESPAPSPPRSLVQPLILGNTPTALELAQTFSRLGSPVNLVIGNTRLLSQEDPEVGLLLQAQLEAEGITVWSHREISQARQLESKQWVQIGGQAIATDRILVATERSPQVEGLNLEGVGVQFSAAGIKTNARFQTTHPRIYALHPALHQTVDVHAIQTVLRNVLFLPGWPSWQSPQSQPAHCTGDDFMLLTEPGVIRQGLTETAARQRYGKQVFVIHYDLKELAQAHILEATTGFLKIVIRSPETVLGTCFVGDPRLLAAAKLQANAVLRRHRLQRNGVVRAFQESWFDWRRDRTR